MSKQKKVSRSEARRMVRLYREGVPSPAIATRMQRCAATVCTVLRAHGIRLQQSTEAPYTPTPEEIAARCAEIRSGWDEATYRRRAGIPKTAFQIPIVQVTLNERRHVPASI